MWRADSFDFPADVPVVIADGRRYVESTTDKYDFIVLDAFNTETHPVHLFTREFFAAVADTLLQSGFRHQHGEHALR